MNKKLNRSDCGFFHIIDLADGETTEGLWDFRQTQAEYIGEYPVAGKTVLEIGTATGSHAFWMEKQGAVVTPMDLSPDCSWDVLLRTGQDPYAVDKAMRDVIWRLNNGWHYCRDRLDSNLELHHGSIYDIPPEYGDFDVVTYGSVLLHTRDPIGALQHGSARAKQAVIITDRVPEHLDMSEPLMQFMPKLGMEKPWGGWTWWWATPKVFENLLTVIGFTKFTVTVTPHLFVPTKKHIKLFTLIAER